MEGVNSSSELPLSASRALVPPVSTFSVLTFGCKVNQYETQLMRETLGDLWTEAAPNGPVDLILVNTCAVTAEAERQGRQALRRARQRHPGARVVAAGCFARRPGVDLVAEGLADAVVAGTGPAALLAALGIPAALPARSGISRPAAGHSRAFVKVQDGCDRRCTFCVVPLVRGRSVSRPAGEIHDEVIGLAASGVPEVVLCGVELSGWRDPATDLTLAGLVRDLAAIPELRRLRLSSLYPGRQPPDLIDLLTGHSKVCRHLHLPVQSGSDAVLRAMHRGYDAAAVLGLVRDLKSRDPRIGLTADILAGFPGETGADAAETEALVEACGFHRLHIFPFSPRPGTPAESLAPVPVDEVEARMSRLRSLGQRLCTEELDRHVGAEVEAVVERGSAAGNWRGTTGSYLPVRFRDPGARPGSIARVRVTGHADGELAGEAAGEPR
ncbi:MAG: MiaB/RimO family radical SAM methylthiotransferase [Candidatus Coatesbacteria bacterium]